MPRRKKRKPNLVYFLQALRGVRVTVELRNEEIVEGHIVSVEHDMSMELSDAIWTNTLGETEHRDKVLIKGTHIRYVPIPDSVDIPKILAQHDARLSMGKSFYKRQDLAVENKLPGSR